jgi:hypothetical protein
VNPADSVEVAYLAALPLEPQAEEVLGEALRRAVGHPQLRTSFHLAGPAVLALESADTAGVGALIELVNRYPRLRIGIRSADADSAATRAVLELLRSAGIDSVRIERRPGPGPSELSMARAR